MQSAIDQSKNPFWRAFLSSKGMWFWFALATLITISTISHLPPRTGPMSEVWLYSLNFLAPLALFCGGLIDGWYNAIKARDAWLASTGRCMRCGYNLRGTESPMCPECGYVKERQSTNVTDAHR